MMLTTETSSKTKWNIESILGEAFREIALTLVMISLVSILSLFSIISSVSHADPRPVPVQRRGTNTGGSDRPSLPRPLPTESSGSQQLNWCRGSRAVLEAARDKAELQIRSTQPGSAKETLRAALTAALRNENTSHPERSLSYQGIARGLDFLDALDELFPKPTLEDQDRIARKTIDYFDFLIEQVSKLDSDLYIPYMWEGERGWKEEKRLHFEDRFLAYARDQLEWLSTAFLVKGTHGIHFPLISPQLYLRTAQLVTGWVAHDLEQSAWANAYSCQTQTLRILQKELEEHNRGSKVPFVGDDAQAVVLTARKLNKMTAPHSSHASGTQGSDCRLFRTLPSLEN